ncbi:hypothetical protein OUZ56_001418 [Daphnia magna]|uniref:Uncharacterized protein n=1 Tax=Daphnia magna TaxID=35525 RepID=A0ABR0A2N4_9CRUS|nr:hypothetical protein OUZ56_001418 [Daphnia magna]
MGKPPNCELISKMLVQSAAMEEREIKVCQWLASLTEKVIHMDTQYSKQLEALKTEMKFKKFPRLQIQSAAINHNSATIGCHKKRILVFHKATTQSWYRSYMVRVLERAKVGQKLESTILATLAGCVIEEYFNEALMGLQNCYIKKNFYRA